MRRLWVVFLAAAAVACGDAHRTPSKPVKSATPEQLHAVAEKQAKSRTAQCLDCWDMRTSPSATRRLQSI